MKLLLFNLLILSTILFSACGGEKNAGSDSKLVDSTSQKETATNSVDKTTIEIINNQHDFGKIVVGDIRYHTYILKNTGVSPLVVDGEPKVQCDCTTIEYYPQKPIGAGALDSVKIKYTSKPHITGMQSKTVRLKANTEPVITKLNFKVEVTPK